MRQIRHQKDLEFLISVDTSHAGHKATGACSSDNSWEEVGIYERPDDSKVILKMGITIVRCKGSDRDIQYPKPAPPERQSADIPIRNISNDIQS